MPKTIATVEFEVTGHSDKYLSIESDQSLLDYEIIVFTPEIRSMFGYVSENYQGKPCLNDSASFKLKEKSGRWRQELRSAFEHGKTVFIFMTELQEVFVDSGNRNYSGTGRSRVTTRLVDSFRNYSLIPLNFTELVLARGREMKPAKDLKFLSAYWKEFGPFSEYEIYFSSESVSPILITKTGNKTIAGVVQGKPGSGRGALVLLPPIHYEREKFTKEKDGKTYWTKEGIAFGHSFLAAIVEIDKALTSGRQQTPMPDWAGSAEFRMAKELQLEKQIGELNGQIESLQVQKRTSLAELENEGALRHLIYETGEALEDSILSALRILGLKAERYKDSESEFDAVFSWEGHRFLGEAEGKDTKAVNVDKISQLERNLSEDFAMEGVTEYAKGILFGNAFRLQKLSERGEYFTEKCVLTAKRLKAALVRTPDLFIVARYVKESADTAFARKCIEAILAAEGVVVIFPSVPNETTQNIVETKAADEKPS